MSKPPPMPADTETPHMNTHADVFATGLVKLMPGLPPPWAWQTTLQINEQLPEGHVMLLAASSTVPAPAASLAGDAEAAPILGAGFTTCHPPTREWGVHQGRSANPAH